MTTSRVPNYVVAYEATDQGNDAIELGIALARLSGAELHVCLVLPRSTAVPAKVPAATADFDSLLEEQARDWLTTAKARVAADVTATTHLVWADSTSDGLLAAVTRFDSDRLIVGAARGGILNRFSIGSVANALLHASPVPVALAPAGYHAPQQVSRVTCMIGTRPGWEALLDSFIALTDALTVDLRCVTLVAVDAARPRSARATPGQTHDAAASAHVAGEEAASALDGGRGHLATVLDYFDTHSHTEGRVSTEVATGTNVEAAVTALDWRPDEIAIVGSSRLARPSTIFLGITANRMLHSLPVPLIVVPHTGAPRT